MWCSEFPLLTSLCGFLSFISPQIRCQFIWYSKWIDFPHPLGLWVNKNGSGHSGLSDHPLTPWIYYRPSWIFNGDLSYIPYVPVHFIGCRLQWCKACLRSVSIEAYFLSCYQILTRCTHNPSWCRSWVWSSSVSLVVLLGFITCFCPLGILVGLVSITCSLSCSAGTVWLGWYLQCIGRTGSGFPFGGTQPVSCSIRSLSISNHNFY